MLRFPVIGPGLARDSHLASEASALSLDFLTGRRGAWRDPGERGEGRQRVRCLQESLSC